MSGEQIGLEPAPAGTGKEGTFLTSCTLMACSAIAIAFALISWAIGGQPYLQSFFGDVVLGVLAACFLVSSAFFYASRLPERRLDEKG